MSMQAMVRSASIEPPRRTSAPPSCGSATLRRVPHDPTFVTSLRDLGFPALLGAVVGAVLSYRNSKRLLDDQAERNMTMLAIQVERDAADQVDRAVHRLATGAKEARGSSDWGRLHNQWQDEVTEVAWRLDDHDLRGRVTVLGTIIFYAFQFSDPAATYGVLRACEDLQDGLRAFLARRTIPPSTFPSNEKLRHLVFGGGGKPEFERLATWFADHPGRPF
jgi:hypothetical protein